MYYRVFCLFVLLSEILYLNAEDVDNTFSHDFDVNHPVSGERVKLKSRGKLSNAVDLDREEGIKRVVCGDDNTILISIKHHGVGRSWKVGQIIMGSSKWDCSANTLDSSRKGIYARIKSIFFPTETGISIHVEKAGAFDVIEEANIQFEYSPGESSKHPPEVRHRHRRYLADVLSKIMGHIDWEAEESTTVPWGMPSPRLFKSDLVDFACPHCVGSTDFSYFLHLVISKNEMNEANIETYKLQLKGNTTIDLKSVIRSKAGKLNVTRRQLFQEPIRSMISIPVAKIADNRLPPVMLNVGYHSTTFLDLFIDSSSDAEIVSRTSLKGSHTITQQYSRDRKNTGIVAPSTWSVKTDNEKLDVIDDLKIKTQLYQQISFKTSVKWHENDMEILFSPPIDVSIKPSLLVKSTSNQTTRCESTLASVSGQVDVADAEFIVNSFGENLWDTKLADGFSKQMEIPATAEAYQCHAECLPQSTNLRGFSDIDHVCGPMKKRVIRDSAEFNTSLIQYCEEDVLFLSEEHSATWCGSKNRTCHSCVMSATSAQCADRMMTRPLAKGLHHLGQLVQAEWQNRKLLVLEAWDEPTSFYPTGQHGNESIYYEGRAAQLSLTDVITHDTRSVSVAQDISEHIYKLTQLATCSGFKFVGMVSANSTYVEVGVSVDPKRRSSKHKRSSDKEYYGNSRETFFNNMERLGIDIVKVSECPKIKNHSSLMKNTFWPEQPLDSQNNVGEDTVGGPVGQINRNNDTQMQRLVEYPFSDIKFVSDHRRRHLACGAGNATGSCSRASNSDDPMDWCTTRIMTPRMAFRLRRLTILVKQKLGSGVTVTVTKAFSDKVSGEDSELFLEGRALRLNVSGSESNVAALGWLAVCAGFDYVQNALGSIEVYVRDQDGFHTTVVTYPSGESFIAVKPPRYFDVPKKLEHSARIPYVIDAYNKNVQVSSTYFTVGDFMEQGEGHTQRYLRLDPMLVGCLEQTRNSLGKSFRIVNAYRTLKPQEDEKKWTEHQLASFQIGRAVEIKPEQHKPKDMVHLGKTLFRSCPSTLRLQRLGLGISIGEDTLYVDIHPLIISNETSYVNLSIMRQVNRDKDIMEVHHNLSEAWSEMTSGGPEIFPYSEKNACKGTVLGKGKEYLTFQFNYPGLCFQFGDKKFCRQSLAARQNLTKDMWKKLNKAAGTSVLPLRPTKDQLETCIVGTCGGCPGSGKDWDNKVKSCSAVVTAYLKHASRKLLEPGERVAFYNTGNVNSSAHSLACSSKCAENIQLYSLLQTSLATRFKPDENATEEMLFGASDNPNPLLEIVEQEIAMAASGVVDVYLEKVQDLSALRDVLKILMINNNAVKSVTFHLFPGVREKRVTKILQQRFETWAGNSCTLWSRFAVAPYTFETVSPERHKRSLHLSRHRNAAHAKMMNWELEWIMKT